jgi:hypothetical protein
MGMYISIGENTGFGTSGGKFDCIVESTRVVLKKRSPETIKPVYKSLDDEGQSFIVLDYINGDQFNIFYKCCKEAMEAFPNSERGKKLPPERMPAILWNWSEVLRIMREDPRFDPELANEK